MKILIYKRTHKGDPDENGIFGNQDCMGRIRNWNYDAVIGIGGKTPWKEDKDIKYKINWIGINPKRIDAKGKRAKCVVFSKFQLYEETGLDIEENFPALFKHMYDSRKRFDMSSDLPDNVFFEVQEILNLVKDSPQSKEYNIDKLENSEQKESTHSSKCKSCINGKNVEVSIDFDETCCFASTIP